MALIAILGVIAVAFAADPYPWGHSDSVAYLVSARNLLRGDGLGIHTASGRFAPLTHFPPLYSTLLAIAGTTGIDLLTGARWIDVFFFALVILGSAYIVWDATRSGLAAVGMALLILTSPRLLTSFSSAMSEPPFMVLAIASLGLAVAAARTGKATLLAGSAIAASLATLTRYVGIGLIPAGAITIAVTDAGPWRSRLAKAAFYFAIALVPLAVWTIVQRATLGGELPRAIQPEVSNLWESLGPFRGDVATWGWYLIPGFGTFPSASWRVRLVVIGAVLAAPLALAAFAVFRNRGWREDPRLSGLVRLTVAAGVSITAYLGALATATLIVWPRPDIDERMLLPLQVLIWLMLTGACLLLLQRPPTRRWAPVSVLLLSIALVVSQAPEAWTRLADLHVNDRGYTTPAWRESGMIAVLRGLPPSTAIVTNESAGVLLWADRPAHDIPELLPEARPRTTFRRFGDESTDPVEVLFQTDDSVLALFGSIRSQLDSIYGSRAGERLDSLVEGLTVVYEGSDGTVYAYPK